MDRFEYGRLFCDFSLKLVLIMEAKELLNDLS